MADFGLIFDLGIIIVAAATLALLARLIKMPTIVAYIVAGLLLGPLTGLIEVGEAIDIISELGIALLLFLVGLELSLEKIRDVGKVAIVAGVGQVTLTALGGFAISFLLGFDAVQAIFIAVALTFSSTVVVVKLLSEKGDMGELYGRIAVGILLVQDIVVVVALTVLAGLANPDELTLSSVVVGIGEAFGGMLVLVVAAMVAARYVLPPLFRWVSRSLEAMFIWGLTWCFALVLAAEAMHLAVEIGAFLAGIGLAQLPVSHELRRRVHPLVNFFIAIFFVSLGVQMDLGAAQAHWVPALVLSVFVLLGKPLMLLVIVGKSGFGERTSFLAGVSLAQISEFSFIFATMGLSAGLIDESLLSLVAVIGLVTISTSAYMIFFSRWLYGAVRSTGILSYLHKDGEEQDVSDEVPVEGHVIVVGMNALGRLLVARLVETGHDVVAVDTDPSKLERVEATKILGDAVHPEILEKAGLEAAALLVSTLQIEETNNMLAYRCRLTGVPCSIHAFDRSVMEDLHALGVSHMIRSKEEGLQEMIAVLRERQIIAA